MSMSTHITGLVSKENDLYKKHAAVLRACIDAGVEKLPSETAIFFGGDIPEEYLFDQVREIEVPVNHYTTESSEVYEVKVSDIDPRTDVVRFYNSW